MNTTLQSLFEQLHTLIEDSLAKEERLLKEYTEAVQLQHEPTVHRAYGSWQEQNGYTNGLLAAQNMVFELRKET